MPEGWELWHAERDNIRQCKMDSTPELQSLLYKELLCPLYHDLSLRIPFDKHSQPTIIRWWDDAVTLLTKTYYCEPWFAKAHERDLQRGTQLGTLRYLPPEVCRLIWQHVVRIDQASGGVDRSVRFVNYNHDFSNHTEPYKLRFTTVLRTCITTSRADEANVRTLRRAMRASAIEVDRVFFAAYTFLFDCPACLLKFLNFFTAGQCPVAHMVVRLFDAYSLSALHNQHHLGGCRCETSARQEEHNWPRAFASLPSGLRSMILEVSVAAVEQRKDFEVAMFLESLQELMRIKCPQAISSIHESNGHSAPLAAALAAITAGTGCLL